MTEIAFHGLFLPEDGLNPDFVAEPFAKIFVARYEKNGRVRVPQWFPPEALREPADLFARFGGGTYEVEARRVNGTVYAKRMFSFPGEAKALVDPTESYAPTPTAAPAANGSSAPATPPGLDPMFAMMMQMQARQQELMLGMFGTLGTVLAAAISGGGSKGSSPAEIMQAMAAMQTATRPPAPPPPTPLAEVLGLQRAIEEAATSRTEAARATARSLAPEESTGETIRAIVEAAGPLLMALPQAPVLKLPGT